jgi:GNAT superfamily N-acetyltransferase
MTWPEAEVPPAWRRQVVALQDQAWPDLAPTDPAPWHDPALRPLSMLLIEGAVVLAALDILSKELHHGGRRFAASGLSTVVTDAARRREGLGSILVRAARAHIDASGADLAIFTCDTPLRGFYERCGFTVLEGTVLIGGTPAQPFPSDRFDKVTLAAFFSDRARLAAPRFAHARIGLFPGLVDRLW